MDLVLWNMVSDGEYENVLFGQWSKLSRDDLDDIYFCDRPWALECAGELIYFSGHASLYHVLCTITEFYDMRKIPKTILRGFKRLSGHDIPVFEAMFVDPIY